ncbi:Eco57I restriction-modification methylase domain-containing protein [Nocardia sp. NPDC004573]
MLNITVAGATLSTYYLADPGLFLHEQSTHVDSDGHRDGIRAARRELRRLIADLDETTTLGVARRQMMSWLAYFGWRFPAVPNSLDEPLIAYDDPAEDAGVGQPRAWVLITTTGQHLDTSPSGRRAGKLRPQRQAETVARSGQLPAVLLSNGAELRVIRRDPGLGGEASYLAVDLAGLAELGDDHEWRVLWALLRPEAFTPDAGGRSLWDRAEKASAEAADTVSENLSDGVRIAIRAVADGALADLRRRGALIPGPRELFSDALKIAYRLLFVAYSEDRGLLPVGTPSYDHGYSLRMLRDHAADPNVVWAPDGGYLWAALRAQWGLLRDGINAGELQIAGFNGGLFDPDKCPQLDDPELVVGDRYVRDLISALSWTQPITGTNNRQVGRRRINYRELGVEQLGSIYEGLLAFEPQIADTSKVLVQVGTGQQARQQIFATEDTPPAAVVIEEYPTGSFYLFEATGQRKGSGSYYTPRQLAHFVVGETLRPLVENATPERILNLRVCDPAMGSGAFLVPAVHFLTEAYGEALARAGEDIDHKLDDTERARYRRLIVERCIYGVDFNPMAVELAKVSLWLTTCSAGKPLSFLDAHLRCGNSVIGAALDRWEGVPEPAIDRGRRVERDLEEQPSLFESNAPDLTYVLRQRRLLAETPSDDRLQVRKKEEVFARLLESDDWTRLRALGDWWVAPYFHPELQQSAASWRQGRRDIIAGQPVYGDSQRLLDRTREEVRPFHWEIEFPEVFFDRSGIHRPDGGFDAMIGNPPWESITFKAAEFYGRFDPEYTLLRGKADKQIRQGHLLERVDILEAKKRDNGYLDGVKLFIKSSGTYRMLYSHGTTFNYYRTFLERELALLTSNGRIGLVIDSGVVADAATAEHRRELLERCTVDRFVLCDNNEKIFPIDSREQFLLLVAGRGGTTDPLSFTSGVTNLEHLLRLDERTVAIPRKVIEALAPDTLAIPDARDSELLELLGTIYDRRPLLLDTMPAGGWLIDWGREFDLHDDRAVFSADATGMPMLEGKHIHQYVHDFAEPTYRLKSGIGEDALVTRAKKRAKKKNIQSLKRHRGEWPLSQAEPRVGVLELPCDHYRPCFREVARGTDERTLISAVIPPGIALTRKLHFFYRSSFDHAANGYRTVLGPEAMVYVVALLNSLTLDFVVRRKVSSTVSKSVMATLPVADVPLDRGPGKTVVDLSARLTCRTPEFNELAQVLGVECGPLSQGQEQALRAALDARIAHLYGLSAHQLELVLADFAQSASSESSPVRPNVEYKQLVRQEFARLVQ